ncbi:MAG: MFS transporter [Chloroflexi bacterium]|nr:MFS transporter [Chloroflexota bacterium]
MAIFSTALNRARTSFYGWRMIGLMLGPRAAGTGIFIVGSTLFIIPLEESLGINRGVTSVLFALSGLVGGLSAPLSGALMDRYGPRKVLLVSVAVLALGYVLFALSPNIVVVFIAFLVPIGLTSLNVAFNGSSGLINNWFDRLKATAMTTMQVGSGLGVLVLVPALALIINAWDWRVAAFAAAAAVLLLGFPATWASRDTPEEMGLLPDGAPAPAAGAHPAAHDGGLSARAAMRTPTFWLITGAAFCFGGATAGLGIHFVPIMDWKGIDAVTAAFILTVSTAFGASVALVAGRLADRFSPSLVAGIVALTAGFGVLVINVAEQTAAIWAGAVLVSASYSLYSLLWASVGRAFGRRAYSTIRGSVMAGSIGGTTGAPILAGFLFERTDSYGLALWIIVGLWVGAAAFLAVSTRRRPAQVVTASE